MPGAITSAHVVFTLIAIGILIGLGWGLVQIALKWPWSDSRVGGAAALICVLLVVIAWLV